MNTDTLSIRPPHPSNIPHTEPSPSGCTADKYPELAVHPRMNSRSEPNTLYCVRTPLTLHMSCHASVCYECFVFTVFIPPLFSGRPRCYRRLHHRRVRLRRRRPYPYCRAPRQAVPLHLSPISPICLYLSTALGICCCCSLILFNCIACLCHPLMILLLSYAAYVTILFSSKPCAMLARIR